MTPDPPKAPDPYATSAASQAANVNTAVAQSYLNNVNETNPFGTVRYQIIGADGQPSPASGGTGAAGTTTASGVTSGSDGVKYPGWFGDYAAGNGIYLQKPTPITSSSSSTSSAATGGVDSSGWATVKDAQGNDISVPRFERIVSFSPEEQAKYDLQNRINAQSGAIAEQQLGRLGNLLNEPINADGLTARNPQIDANDTRYQNMMALPQAGNYQLQGGYDEYRTRAENALRTRSQSERDRQFEAELTRLRNMGVAEGSEAWNNQLDTLNRQRNDAELAIIQAGGQEADRAFNQDLGTNNYNFSRDMGLFQTGMDNANFNLQRDQSIAGFNDQRRAGELQERLTLRNQPINEITALLSGNQVSVPQFQQYQAGQIAPTNVAGNIWNAYNANYNNYQNQVASSNAALGGLFGLGASALGGGMRGLF